MSSEEKIPLQKENACGEKPAAVPEPAGRKIIRPDGAVIYYETFRHGPDPSKAGRLPVVFIHGNGEDHRSFDGQFGSIGSAYDIIAPDSRGRGRSDLGPSRLTISLLADDIAAVLDAEKIQKCHILGFSDGGNIAIDLALRRPGLAASLILAGANLFPAGIITSYRIPTVAAYYLAVLCAPFSPKAARKKQLLGLMTKEPHFSPAALGKIKAPTLVVAGENDMIEDSHTRLIAASIPGAELEIIRGGDHFVPMNMPGVFNGIVLSFLEKRNRP